MIERSKRAAAVAFAVLLAVLPTRAIAAGQQDGARPPGGTVRVTAGEHGNYSRVVFAPPAGHAYRTEVEPAAFRIVFPDALVGFDYDEVYPKRRAHRVVMAEPALSAEGASLRLRLGCDCDVRTFVLGEKLVVDVFDAASGAADPPRSERARPAERADARSDGPERGDPRALVGAPPAAARGDATSASEQGQPRPEFMRRVQGLSDPGPAAGEFDPAQMERMLAWAIEQGHLSDAAAKEGPAPRPRRPDDDPAAIAATASRGAMATEDGTAPPAASENGAAAASADGCPDGSAFEVIALAGDGAFADEHARRQAALSRALAADGGIAAAEHALAGLYIARLMPQEALEVLGEAPGEKAAEPARAWLRAAALVLAGRPNEPAVAALRNSSCEGVDAELWRAVMRAAEGPLPGILERDAILVRLAKYPAALRVELGLRLAEAGIGAGPPESTALLLDLVEEAAPTDEARARLLFLRGRLAAARGDFAGAATSWREAAALPGEGSLRASLALVQAGLERGGLDEAAALLELERLAYDWRGHPLQLDIVRSTAAIHERRGRLLRALDALEDVALGAAGQPNGRAAARLATDLMRRTYAGKTDLPVDQMTAFWRYEGFVPPDREGASVRLGFARMLIAQGLPAPAIGLLQPLAHAGLDGPLAQESIDLLAEGRLAADQPEKALEVLRAAARHAPAPRPERNRLAARALAALGRFAEAAGVLHGQGGDEAARLQADYLWKAGLWTEAATAYRELLQGDLDPERSGAAGQAAIRLAAAAHMARRPGLLEAASRGAAAAGDEVVVSAFSPPPSPARGRRAARTAATQLLHQATGLAALAERYGLARQEAP